MKEVIYCELLREGAKVPSYAHNFGDSAADLYSCEDLVIPNFSRRLVGTGIALAIPLSYGGFIWDRSSMGAKGIHVLGGVIDANYRGEIKVLLANLTTLPYEIKQGDRIAQITFQPVYTPLIREAFGHLDDYTDRGSKGFGSSGR